MGQRFKSSPSHPKMSQYIKVDAVKARVKEITASIRDPKAVKKSDKAMKIEGLLKNFGNGRLILTQICSELLGEPLTQHCSSGHWPRGCMVVPIKEKIGSHDYPIDKPVLMYALTSSTGLRSNGCVGNNLPKMNSKHMRCATDEEIDSYFEEFNFGCGNNHMGAFISKL